MEKSFKAPSNNGFILNSQEDAVDSSITNTNKGIYLFLSLILAFIFDRLFLTGEPGISVVIFTILFTAVFYVFNKEAVNLKNPVGIFAFIALVISALNYAIYTNPIMEFLNFIAIPLLCTACFTFVRYRPCFWERLQFIGEILFRIFICPLLNIIKPFSFLKGIISKNNIKFDSRKKSIILGIIVSLLFLVVIVPLLSSADMVFNYFLSNIADSLKINNFSEIIFHTVFIFIAFIYVFGYMLSFKYNLKVIDDGDKEIKKWINPLTAATSLIPLIIVYLLFSIIQFSYLYGESGASLPEGFTYAEYARRGFFELVAVTVINFTIILFVKYFADIKLSVYNKLLSILLTLMTAFTFNMLFSANFKLSLYEKAYGFTYLRFFVHCFILLLFLLLVFVLAGIWVKKINIIKSCLIVSIALFTILNTISPDKIIAQKNIQRYYENGKIDIQYLSQLTNDAVPILSDFSRSDNPAAKAAGIVLIKKKSALRQYRWYEFNFSNHRAYMILKDIN